jgi:hypothetical protein
MSSINSFVSVPPLEAEVEAEVKKFAEKKKRGRKSHESKGIERATEKFTILLQPSEREAMRQALPLYFKALHTDPTLLALIATKEWKNNWESLANENQMVKHALRAYLATLGVDFDAKPPKPPTA